MVVPPKTGYAQDMPPAGGYGSIQWERIRLKTIFTTKLTLGLFAATTIGGYYLYYLNWLDVKREETELRSARFVLFPLMVAERDRMFLKQVRKNREYETELMKNVPNWEVGTYFGEPVYITKPKGMLIEPHFYEFYAHNSINDQMIRCFRRHWT